MKVVVIFLGLTFSTIELLSASVEGYPVRKLVASVLIGNKCVTKVYSKTFELQNPFIAPKHNKSSHFIIDGQPEFTQALSDVLQYFSELDREHRLKAFTNAFANKYRAEYLNKIDSLISGINSITTNNLPLEALDRQFFENSFFSHQMYEIASSLLDRPERIELLGRHLRDIRIQIERKSYNYQDLIYARINQTAAIKEIGNLSIYDMKKLAYEIEMSEQLIPLIKELEKSNLTPYLFLIRMEEVLTSLEHEKSRYKQKLSETRELLDELRMLDNANSKEHFLEMVLDKKIVMKINSYKGLDFYLPDPVFRNSDGLKKRFYQQLSIERNKLQKKKSMECGPSIYRGHIVDLYARAFCKPEEFMGDGRYPNPHSCEYTLNLLKSGSQLLF